MLNRVVDSFVRQNATLALMDNLLLSEIDAITTLTKLSPIQMVMLNQHLPAFRIYIISLIELDGIGPYRSWKDFSNKETWDIRCESWCSLPEYTYNFPKEFTEFYNNKLENLTREKANIPINAVASLTRHLNTNINICFDAVRSLQGNYQEITDFAIMARRIAINLVQTRNTSNINEIFSTLSKKLCNQYQTISAGMIKQLITPKFLEEIQNAEIALIGYTPLTLEERAEALFFSTGDNLGFLPEYLNLVVTYVYHSFQTQDKLHVMSRLNEMYKFGIRRSAFEARINHLSEALKNHIDKEKYSHWSEDILPKIFTPNFIAIINQLPTVMTYNGVNNLGLEATKHNQKGLMLAAQHIANGNSINDFDYHYQTIAPPVRYVDYVTPTNVVGGVALVGILAYGIFKFATHGVRSPKEINDELLKHLSSLRSEPKPDFLTAVEITDYQKFIAQIKNVEHQTIARKEFRQYHEYISGICPLSRSEINEIDTPITVEINIRPGINILKTYEFKDYIFDIENSSKLGKVVQDPLTKENLSLQNPKVLHIKGFPSFIKPLLASIREKLVTQNTVNSTRSFQI